jgi:predicted nucleotidyltransferase
LLPPIEGAILTALAGTTRPLSGREVARVAGTSVNGSWRALRRLVAHGLVSQQEAGDGAALLYTLNREHVAAEPVLLLVRLRDRFFERIRDSLAGWPIQPLHVSVFGSTARGNGDTESDVDLFVVRPREVNEDDEAWRAQLGRLAEDVRSWSGNQAGIAELAESELPRLRREQPPIVEELERDAVVLVGPPIAELVGRKRR